MIIGECDSAPPVFIERPIGETGCVHGWWQLNFRTAACESGEEAGSQSASAGFGANVEIPPPDGAAKQERECRQLQGPSEFLSGIFALKLFDFALNILKLQFLRL